MKVAVFGKSFNADFYDAIYRIFEKLNKNNVEIYVYKPFYDFISEKLYFNPRIKALFRSARELKDIEIVISVGGDGTFLECVAMLKNKTLPIVGINSGRLGFLSSISKNNIEKAIDNLVEKKYFIEKRTLLNTKINGKKFNIGDFHYALNEVTLSKKDNSSMIKVEVEINNTYFNTYWADGLIIATPTGSTAYSLSSGGPIIFPNSKSFVITPIAPHTLTVRPVVVPEDIELKITATGRGNQFLLALDSRSESIDYDTEIIITKANISVKMVRFFEADFFETLRQKLMWGLDIRN